MKRVSFIFGTRPEAIKLACVIERMRSSRLLEPHVCVTAQHRELLDQVLSAFAILPDADLNLMQPNQSLAELTSAAIRGIDAYLSEACPDLVIVQGDTTSVFCAALCAFYRRIPVGHVEAGLRTGNKLSPFPEEVNRILASRLCDIHFAPTESARENLLAEGVEENRIHVTGNTVIDTLLMTAKKVRGQNIPIPGLPPEIISGGGKIVLITGHRRESFGLGFENICRAIAELAKTFPDVSFVYPVHLNPNVREPVFRVLGNLPNVRLLAPLAYTEFVALMDRSTLLLTDSGGVQEEAPSLGKPVLVMRDTTERPEGVAAGTARLVGTNVQAIVQGVSTLLCERGVYNAMAQAKNPYGDGHASGKIVEICKAFLHEIQ